MTRIVVGENLQRHRYPLPLPIDSAAVSISGWRQRHEVPYITDAGVLLDLSDEQQCALTDFMFSKRRFELAHHFVDKLGGWGSNGRILPYAYCPECDEEMQVFFQLISNGHVNYAFHDEGILFLLYCKNHPHILQMTYTD